VSTARLEPIPPRQWSQEMTDGLREAYRPEDPRHPVSPLDPDSPKGLNAMGVLAHHPELTNAYNRLVRHALYFTTLSIRQRELLILRVAHLRGSRYEWAQHVYQAGVAGITPEEVAAVRAPSTLEWPALERALLSAADELVADARIADETYAVLAAELDAQQLMDVVFTVGAYDVFAMALRTFDVALDDDLQPYA